MRRLCLLLIFAGGALAASLYSFGDSVDSRPRAQMGSVNRLLLPTFVSRELDSSTQAIADDLWTPVKFMTNKDQRRHITGDELVRAGLPMTGKLRSPDGLYGTAFSFMRKDLILTAYHIVHNEPFGLKGPISSFTFIYTDEQGSTKEIPVDSIVAEPDRGGLTESDQIVLKLATPVETSAIPAQPAPREIQQRFVPGTEILNIAYNSDLKLNIQKYYCKIHDKRLSKASAASEPRVFLHDCGLKKGASGGPIFARIDGQLHLAGLQARQSLGDRDFARFDPTEHVNFGVFLDEDIIGKVRCPTCYR